MKENFKEISKNYISSNVTPELYLLDFIKRLEIELSKRSQEAFYYQEQCVDLKKKLKESDSIKKTLYNYVRVNKKNLKKDHPALSKSDPLNSLDNDECIKSVPQECLSNLYKSNETTKIDNNDDKYVHIEKKIFEKFKKSLKNAYLKLDLEEKKNLDTLRTDDLLSIMDEMAEKIGKDIFYSPVINSQQVNSYNENILKNIENFNSKAKELRKVCESESVQEYTQLMTSFWRNLKISAKKWSPESSIIPLINGLDNIINENEEYEDMLRKKIGSLHGNTLKDITNQLNYLRPAIIKQTFEGSANFSQPIIMHSSSISFTSKISTVLNDFLENLVSDLNKKYKKKCAKLSINEKTGEKIIDLSPQINKIFDICQSESFAPNIETKIRIIEECLREYSQSKSDILSYNNLRKAIILITTTLDNYLKLKTHKDSNDLEKDTFDAVYKIVFIYNELLNTFSKKTIDQTDDIIKKTESLCSTLTNHLDCLQKSLSDKMNDMKNIMSSLKISSEKNKEAKNPSQELINSDKLIQKIDDTEKNSSKTTLNSDMFEATSQATSGVETIIKYYQDLFTKGIKLSGKMDNVHSSKNDEVNKDDLSYDEDLDSIQKNIKLILSDKSDQSEKNKPADRIIDEDSSMQKGENIKDDIDINYHIKLIKDTTQNLQRFIRSLLESKTKFETDQVLKNEKVGNLIKSFTPSLKSEEIQSKSHSSTITNKSKEQKQIKTEENE